MSSLRGIHNSPIVSNVAGNVNIIYGDRDKHRLRITYWRLKGIAADFLVRGLLSPEWESILGGQQEILNNDVLKYARDISARFALPAHGDLYVGDGRIVQGDLERLTKLHGDKAAARNLRLALGGQQGYSLIFPDRDAAFTIAKTDRWPNAYSLFHVCDSSGEASPHLWKFVTRSDLESYSQRIGEYIQYITRSDSNISYLQGVQHGPTERKVIDALLYITQEQMPSDFLLVLGGLAAHGGWELNFQPREIEIEIAAVENSSTKTISIGDLGFAATDFRTLTSYDEATKKLGLGSKSIMKPLTSGLLRPGEKIVIPLRLAFVLKFDVKKCNSPQYRGDPIELQSGYSGMEKFHKSRQSMQMNSLPSATPRYTLGPAWQIRSLAVDGLTIPIRQANFNGVNIYLGNEKGSCPFVYTRSDDTGLWLGEGHVLLGATSRLLERRETKLLKNAPRELRIIQQEDELAYIREIYVEERFGDGRIVVHRPDSETGEFLVTRSKERILRFSNLSANDSAAYALTITGYYIPFGSLNFESKFINAANERAGSSR